MKVHFYVFALNKENEVNLANFDFHSKVGRLLRDFLFWVTCVIYAQDEAVSYQIEGFEHFTIVLWCLIIL